MTLNVATRSRRRRQSKIMRLHWKSVCPFSQSYEKEVYVVIGLFCNYFLLAIKKWPSL